MVVSAFFGIDFEIGMKTDLFLPVATAEFSKFDDILSTPL